MDIIVTKIIRLTVNLFRLFFQVRFVFRGVVLRNIYWWNQVTSYERKSQCDLCIHSDLEDCGVNSRAKFNDNGRRAEFMKLLILKVLRH